MGPPEANWSLKSVQVCRPENFCVQVWTAHEAGRTARVARAASRATQVRVWDCMYGKVESFIHFVSGVIYWKCLLMKNILR